MACDGAGCPCKSGAAHDQSELGSVGAAVRVLTLGTFDGLHAGHTRFLRNCADLGRLTVGVNSDQFVQQFKRKPTFNQTQRLDAVAAVRGVGKVRLNDGPGKDLIEDEQPDVLAVGPDWLGRDYLAQIGMTEQELFGLGVILAFLPPPRQPGLASSRLHD